MKRTLQLFYFTLLTFFIIGNASAATYSIDWNAYSGTGWYVLDLDQRSPYPIAESFMHITYGLNGGDGVFTHYFNGIESSWSLIVNGLAFSGVNPGWNPSSQMITPARATWSGVSGFDGKPPQTVPVLMPSTGTEPDFLPEPAAIPIPSAIWLIGSGFIGIVSFGKKLRRKTP